ncbi:ArdC-like ssDNA-binding domain-containing protein [Amorphus sp. MBR-141]
MPREHRQREALPVHQHSRALVAAQTQNFTRPEWGTYRQWAAKGARMRRGEKGTTTVFYKELAVDGGRCR